MLQVGFGQQRYRHRRDADRQQGADFARCRRQRRDQPAPARIGAFEQIGDNAGVLAADREPHHAAQGKEQPRGRHTDLRECRQQGRQQHRRRHQGHRQQQHRPPAVAVGDVAERHRTDRPHEVSEREPAQRRRQRRAAASEEHPADDGGEVQVEREIVPFDHRRQRRDGERAVGHAVSHSARTPPRRANPARRGP